MAINVFEKVKLEKQLKKLIQEYDARVDEWIEGEQNPLSWFCRELNSLYDRKEQIAYEKGWNDGGHIMGKLPKNWEVSIGQSRGSIKNTEHLEKEVIKELIKGPSQLIEYKSDISVIKKIKKDVIKLILINESQTGYLLGDLKEDMDNYFEGYLK